MREGPKDSLRTHRIQMKRGRLRRSVLRFLQAFSLFALAFSASCRHVCAPPPAVDQRDSLPAPSQKLDVDFYLDATLSMKGFVTTGSETYFQQALPILESAVISGWPEGKASFFKFGNDVATLQGREYLRAGNQVFYLDRDYNTLTLIERVIDAASRDHLTVVVTDLYQNEADVNQLSSKLRDKYVAEGLAIGLYGLKSQFKGSIYDVGPDKYSFTYNTENLSPKNYRPFYLLAFGSHADIAKYFESLDHMGFDTFPAEAKARIIISPYLTSSQVSFETATIAATNKISRLEHGTLLPASLKDVRVREFKIAGIPDLASFKADLKLSPLRNVVEASRELQPDVAAWKCDEKAVKADGTCPLVESTPAREALLIKNANSDAEGQSLQFEAEVRPKALPGPGNYCYRIILRPSSYKLSSWVTDWDLTLSQINATRTNQQQFDGSRTYNLKSFLDTLWGATQEKHRPKLAEIYCYLKREE